MQLGGVKVLLVAKVLAVASTAFGSDTFCIITDGAIGLADEDKQTRRPVTARKPPAIWKMLPRNGCVRVIGIKVFSNSSNADADKALVMKPIRKSRKPT